MNLTATPSRVFAAGLIIGTMTACTPEPMIVTDERNKIVDVGSGVSWTIRLDEWEGRDYLAACDHIGGVLYVTVGDNMVPVTYDCEEVDH